MTSLESEKHCINWFPGHMNKAFREIKKSFNKVDIILEVRDGRSPLVTGNKAMSKEMGERPRLIVINKTHLADPCVLKLWEAWFLKEETPFVFVHDLDKRHMKKIIRLSKEVIFNHRLQSNPDAKMKERLRMIVIGLPNTGKSTIINKLANRSAVKAADRPGQTQHQLWVKVDKELEVLDTPGVMPAKILKYEHGLWLAAIHAIPNHIVTPDVSAKFIVEYFLEKKSEMFLSRYRLNSANIGLTDALEEIAKVRGCLRGKESYDFDRVYKLILSDFRKGILGKASFGLPPS